jgi:hypothetical protein
MSKQLAERADAIRARFKELEAKPGSGYHDADRHYVRIDLVEHPANRFVAPQKNGLPPASKHLVAFFDHQEETVTFAGDDAGKALAAIGAWSARFEGVNPHDLPGTQRKLLTKIIPRLKVTEADGSRALVIRMGDWNDVHFALEAEMVGIQGSSVDPKQHT